MDRKEVIRRKARKRSLLAPKPRPETIKLWRRLMPYGFMGIVFVLGFLALLAIINGHAARAGKMVLLAMVLAGAEYYYRRWVGGPTSLEDEFSALSDFFCFAVVPGLLIHQVAFRDWGFLGLIGLFLILFGGVIRLSLYKLYNPVSRRRGFIGLPMTITSAFISLTAQLLSPGQITASWRLGLLAGLTGLVFLAVSTIPYPNPTERPAVYIPAVLVVMAVFLGGAYTLWASWLLLAGGAAYIFFAPLWERTRNRSQAR